MRKAKFLQIASLSREPCSGPVHNLAVKDDESFVADGVVVHNCRSVLVPITAIDTWDGKESPPPSAKPQDGFS